MSRVGLDPTGTTLPDTDYTPPAGALYVSPDGDDTRSRTTAQNPLTPLKTLFGPTGAYSKLIAGDTVVMASGVYEEGQVGGTSFFTDRTKACTIQAAPGAQVWFDGSVHLSSGWTGSGPVWSYAGWTYNAGNTSGWTNDDHPGVARANRGVWYFDQCYVNGVRQQRVTTTTPGPGQYSIVGTTIYVAANPATNEIRMSQYRGLAVCSAQINWKGIGFRRYSGGSTPTNTQLGVTSGGSTLYYGGASAGSVIENCAFVDTSFVAVVIAKTDFTLNRNVFLRSGKIHLEVGGTTGGDRLTVSNSIFDRANMGGWPPEPTAGAMKIVKCDQSWIVNNLVTNFPYCYGIWYDIDCTRAVVAFNEVNGGPTSKTGILWEISGGGLLPLTGTRTQHWSYIVGNNVQGSYSYATLCALTCNYTKIWNNTLEGGITCNLMIRQDDRPKAGATANTYNVGAQSYPSNNMEVCNNNIGRATGVTDAIVFAETRNTSTGVILYPTLTGDQMISRFSGNWFKPNGGTGPQSVQWGTAGNSERVSYRNIPVTAGPSALDSRQNFVAADPDWKNFQQTTEPLAVDRVPIPADVQAIIDTYGPEAPPPPPPPPPTPTGTYSFTRKEGGEMVPYTLNRFIDGQWKQFGIKVHTLPE